MIDHGTRSTWGPGPSRSRLRAQKHDLSAPTKTGLVYNFCFIKYSPSCTVEAVDAQPGLGSGPGLGGQELTKLTIGKAGYNFCVINFA
jgi:hypothetical protein